jgi:hypothetical protein
MEVPSFSGLSRVVLFCAFTVSLAGRTSADSVPGVTVEAQREQQKLKHDVNEFVSTAIVQSHYEESLERWTYEPVCPLVAGLNKAEGEFILARLSQIVRTAGAPLAPEKCKPNFFVVVSADPEPGLKRAAKRNNGQMFNYETGERLKQFVESSRPIRVWYNAGTTSIDGALWYRAFWIQVRCMRGNLRA